MKKLIVATLLVVGMSTFAQVENKKKESKEPMEKMSPAERVEKGLKRMTKQLNLTEAQQKEMKILMAEQEAKRADADFKPSKEDRLAMKEKMKDKIKEKKEKSEKTEDK